MRIFSGKSKENYALKANYATVTAAHCQFEEIEEHMLEVDYLPFRQRTPDDQYQNAVKAVLDRGVQAKSAHETASISLFGQLNFCYDLRNGFPLIPDRNLNPEPSGLMPVSQWEQAKGEILAFINGKHTQEGLQVFGCPTFWRDTVTGEEGKKKCEKRGLVEGDLGPASYGAVYAHFPLIEPRLSAKLCEHFEQNGALGIFNDAIEKFHITEGFNQVESLLTQIKARPELRTHFLDPWYSPGIWRENQSVVVCPCHGWIHIRILEGKLYYHMYQRSGDMLLGVPNNIAEHAALALAIARATGYSLAQYSQSIADAHIYENHLEYAKTIVSRPPRRLPTVMLREGVEDLFAIRKEDYILLDYTPHPGIPGIPLSI